MSLHPHQFQESIFTDLVAKGKTTAFGKEHNFGGISSHKDFVQQVPLNSYEQLRPYMERALAGERNVLWPGKPKYVVGTSGTTGGIKYIPLSKESLPYHYTTARNAVFNYCLKYGLLGIFDHKLLFLSGSPKLSKQGQILSGRLSGIVNHQIPKWLRFNQVPSYDTNCIEDWELKINQIVTETMSQSLSMVSGIPPWVLMYYEKLLELSGKATVKEVFPNYGLFVYGGVNYKPYKARFEELVGGPLHTIETYPSSEGFIAFQDIDGEAGLLLNVNGGVFFEFVPVEEIYHANPTRLTLKDVEVARDYAIIMNNNAGLWASKIGDIVEFTSTSPYRVLVKGRTEQFLSAFGEHVIAAEVEQALSVCQTATGINVDEFTVAPNVNPNDGGMPYHEWFLESSASESELREFARVLDQCMQSANFHYKDLIDGKFIRPLRITKIPKGSLLMYMKSKGKLGGQNKVPHLRNDRKIANWLEKNLSKS